MPGPRVRQFLVLVTLWGCDERASQGLPAASTAKPSPEVSVAPSQLSDGDIGLAAGSFTMGSPRTERCREQDEALVKVMLTRSFAIAPREVTQREFKDAMGYNPSFRKACDACPVDSVTHHEAAAYCNALSAKSQLPHCYRCTGSELGTRCEKLAAPTDQGAVCKGFRLPSEAEWEYAARAGTDSATYAGRLSSCMGADPNCDRIAWYKASSRGRSRPTGEKEANRWGLFDMLGNVYEWTADWYAAKLSGGRDPLGPETGQERVLRGGSWYHNAEHARAANRYAFRPEKRLSYVGFRCVRTLDSKAFVGAD